MALLASNLPHEAHITIPKRIQWDANGGYCGETCLVSAGLYYGQYLSQYDVRIAGKGPNGQLSEVLIQTDPAGSASTAAKNLFLTSSFKQGNKNDPDGFLSWVKAQVLDGHPVAIGVYMNNARFGEGDDENYDHIILVTGVGSEKRFNDKKYSSTDVLYYWDNGLWTDDPTVPAYGSCQFGKFANTRTCADCPTGNLYSLPKGAKVHNYGIAITGAVDPNGDPIIPLSVTVSNNEEIPEMVDESILRPARPDPITLTITAVNLKSGTYDVYKYDSLDGSSKKFIGKVTPDQPTLTDTIPPDSQRPPVTSSIAIYRAVKAK
jgi:hypothetical protein